MVLLRVCTGEESLKSVIHLPGVATTQKAAEPGSKEFHLADEKGSSGSSLLLPATEAGTIVKRVTRSENQELEGGEFIMHYMCR